MSSNWSSWRTFSDASPVLAADVATLFEQYGRGFGYLATIRRDGGPRLHPVSPVIADGGLYCFVIPSPKRRDLDRDGRYALHSYPAETTPDEAYLAGRARAVEDRAQRERVAQEYQSATTTDWKLYELGIDVAMVTHRTALLHRADHRIWRSDGPRFDLFRL